MKNFYITPSVETQTIETSTLMTSAEAPARWIYIPTTAKDLNG